MILLVGGFGNDRDYFRTLIRHMERHDFVVFYEFDTVRDHRTELPNIIKTISSNNHSLTIIAFSISCNVIIHMLHDIDDPKINIKKLILLDPANPFCSLQHKKIENLHSSYDPLPRLSNLKTKLSLLNYVFESKICSIIFKMCNRFQSFLECITYLVCQYEANATPASVNRYILKQDPCNIKTFLLTYLLSFSPFNIIKYRQTPKLHVFTGCDSQYYSYCSIISDQNPFLQLHTLKDEGHHIPNNPTQRFISLLEPLLSSSNTII